MCLFLFYVTNYYFYMIQYNVFQCFMYVIELEYLCSQLNHIFDLKFKSFWNPKFSFLKYIFIL